MTRERREPFRMTPEGIHERVVVYTVIPKLPERLKPLDEMARNLWFCWNLEVIDLFRSIDPDLWEEAGHNPLAMVSSLGNDRIKNSWRMTASCSKWIASRPSSGLHG